LKDPGVDGRTTTTTTTNNNNNNNNKMGIGVMKTRMRRAGPVALMEERRGVYRVIL
jgi:hypothetical protein